VLSAVCLKNYSKSKKKSRSEYVACTTREKLFAFEMKMLGKICLKFKQFDWPESKLKTVLQWSKSVLFKIIKLGHKGAS